ncbi:MAG: Phenylalanine-tRNA ligase beta subunit [Microgenomates group bacterium GW2011_GWA2_40_6]|nr:MAG: Phenylalanine-tRNA ligase beta subunit [Microgenomates group bacterium GW2011_GWA2_40_6]
MKIIFSHLKTWLPNLSVDAKTLRDDLTLIGHFASGYEEIDGEIILDLEIRQNRADCLGYYGIARDLAVFYKISLVLPQINTINYSNTPVPITISSPDVHRIQATSISDIKNSPSPDWLVRFLKLHDINSINTLVDLTNYIMLEWGIPCHAFDKVKASKLIWENNTKYPEFISLDGTKIKLQPQNLVISDGKEVLSLSFIGGQNSGIRLATTDSILEMAIYNRLRVRNDSRSLKTITEASIRLDKELDTETIPLAFSHLISLILKHCHAIISSKLLDGCTIKNNLITPPSLRKDLNLEEDLIEEVIRFYGYNKIPTDQPVDPTPLPDITPPILYLVEKLKDDLVNLGYDEIRSWPLVKNAIDPKTVVKTENSINSDYPYLRQSIIQSLQNQLDQYNRYKAPAPQFFEIGKIFSQKEGKYIEQYALGVSSYDNFKLITDIENIFQKKFSIFHSEKYLNQIFVEIILDDLPKPDKYIPQIINNTAIELTSQIITLDANVNFDSPQDPLKLITKYSSSIDPKTLWSMEIIDIYQNRYTFRVSYYNCNDKTAKKIHLKTFNLN